MNIPCNLYALAGCQDVRSLTTKEPPSASLMLKLFALRCNRVINA